MVAAEEEREALDGWSTRPSRKADRRLRETRSGGVGDRLVRRPPSRRVAIGAELAPAAWPHNVTLVAGSGVLLEPGANRRPEMMVDWPMTIIGAVVEMVKDGFSVCSITTVTRSDDAMAFCLSPANLRRRSTAPGRRNARLVD